jgi:hypothetical protein
MGDLYYIVPQVVFVLPTVVTLVVGLVLLWARRDRLAPRTRSLGVAGLAVLLAGALADVVYVVLLPRLLRDGKWEQTGVVLAGSSLLFIVLHCLGLALLIAALLGTAPLGTASFSAAPPGEQPRTGQLW